jgi:multidrug efflux pump subunit AcrB
LNIVRLALRRPITILVAVLALALAATFAVIEMPRDILPSLGIPTIYVVQPYGGLSPSQVESYVTYYYEYHFLYISGIRHIESRNIESAALIKLEFFPGTNMAQAMSETVSYVSRSRAFMPPGTVPPFVMRFDAGSAPVGNLVFTGKSQSLSQLQDLALNAVRPLFATLKGVSAPPPFGATARTIVAYIDPRKMAKYSLSASEVANAIVTSNTLVPAGNIPVGKLWPMVPINSVVSDIQALEDVPIRTGTVPTVYLRDVGKVVDGTDITTCYALINGKKTVYIPVTKRAEASTLAVVDLVKKSIPRFESVVPKDVKISYEFDQSVYVRRAIKSLMLEGMLGAVLTGVMVLLFLRDLRSVLIVVINIPLALMTSLFAQWVLGQTVNVMTLGGLALAVGLLVDETTVTIENIHTHHASGKSIARAAFDGTNEILKPAFLILLCVLSVFLPSFFMEGVARALFVPLTIAVGFSMIGSFVLSRTLVPVLTTWLLKGLKKESRDKRPKRSRLSFDQFRRAYARLIRRFMRHKFWIVLGYALLTLSLAAFLIIHVGREIFPIVNEGQFKLRIRAPTGSHIDTTEAYVQQVLKIVNQTAGAANIHESLAFIGQQPPEYAINNIYQWSSGPQEALLEVALKEGTPIHVEELKEELRGNIKKEIPELEISFEPSGLIDTMMSQGSPTPIEISVNGQDMKTNRDYAEELRKAISDLPFLRDLQFGQVYTYPAIAVNVDRPRAGAMGLTLAQIGQALVPATSSTRFTIPNFWSDPKTGVNYQVQVQIPQGRIASVEDLKALPVTVNQGAIRLDRFAEVKDSTTLGEYDRYDMQRMVTLTANLYGKDLGHAAEEIEQKLKPLSAKVPRGVELHYRGQIKSLSEMLEGLTMGLALAIAVIFLLLAGNFESFSVALSILATIPAVLSGALGALALTGTTLNIESFMGTIMAIGVAVSNSILLVTFAERDRIEKGDAEAAAIEGAQSRLRPILMTSSAMLIGMIPMAMGWGEGKQTAPLGRAVMGGLIGSTITTLLVLPLVFAIIQKKRPTQSASLDPDDPTGAHYEKEAAK